ncbi:phosphoribosylglycinamide formyltransferase activity [Nesidiocoris tenuis]|uniref:Trifunctional purine biosynthetic protein adenosine-3 n=1 Tax=Nesidiocoris tenuis TaxID=355587 RepID=A0ABN7B0M3_9HEMI|nr:phosphoribosylglycinamide formyltransferase activity [Nesidiocoris tenuis]
MNNILVIGNGAREHAICWKLAQAPEVKHVFCVPGSVGIAATPKVENVALDINNHKALCDWSITQCINLVVVGPEAPLENGIADAFKDAGIPCFGPRACAARIETDKEFAKEFMVRHGIPTARFKSFQAADDAKKFIRSSDFKALVVKASGIAAGKGVIVAKDVDEACAAVDSMLIERKFGEAGSTVVVEEVLEGEEVSVLAFSDGVHTKVMLPAQDHKRVFDEDQGANTGGMGAYAPCPLVDSSMLSWIATNVIQKAINGLRKENKPFVGCLFAGLMMTSDGPKVLEYNCRFGDPETEVLLPLLRSNLFTTMMACCRGTLDLVDLEWEQGVCCVGVVMSSRGYPESSSKGDLIEGLEEVQKWKEITTFHAGTAKTNSKWVTNGGRVLINVAKSPSLVKAANLATSACQSITIPGGHFRKDIAHKGIPRWILNQGAMSYKKSGVDIEAGEALVSSIVPSVNETKRAGVLSHLGGFGAFFDPALSGFKNPILVSGTDGVGTKLKVAQAVGNHNTIGIDLVAMCVNDILCHGAEPLFFLDYFACGHLEVEVAAQVVKGVTEGCKLSGCALVGGETAEMPGLYGPGDYDLAGFAVGAVEKGSELPRVKSIVENDVVIALPSSGVHSNGLSLARKIVEKQGLRFSDKAPFSNQTIGNELLTPTRIYVQEVLPVVKTGKIKAIAHITGGGLTENIIRVLPDEMRVVLDATKWKIPPIFPWLSAVGDISESEMLRTFNCGVGLVLIVSPGNADDVVKAIKSSSIVGSVAKKSPSEKGVLVNGLSSAFSPLMKPHIPHIIQQEAKKKRIGVLISGSGTNLQSLIDSVADGRINGEIVLVISNKTGVQGLSRAEKAGIPSIVIPHTKFPTREAFEEDVHNHLLAARVDLVVLAGFMRVLTGWFVSRWRGKIINVHPSLLPSFKGVNAWQQALDAGVAVSGCTVHYVEEDIDNGAIIAQGVVPVSPNETVTSLQDKIRVEEHKALSRAVQLICSGSAVLDLVSNKIVWRH